MGGSTAQIDATGPRVATIHDVARRAGVSPSTVSRALNGGTKANWPSAARRVARIRRIAREMHYEPNTLSRALLTGRTMTIGLVGAWVGTWPYNHRLEVLQRGAQARGYGMQIVGADALGPEPKVLRGLARRTDGLIVYRGSEIGESYRQALLDAPVPVVFLDHVPAWATMGVRIDRSTGVEQAVTHLASLGHRRAAYIGRVNNLQYSSKLDHYRRACAAAGLECRVERSWLLPDDGDVVDNAWSVGRRIGQAASEDRPTALLGSNDETAAGLIAGLRETGLCVPEDVSVVGFDDASFAKATTPALTTVRQPVTEPADQALDMLLTAMDREAAEDAPAPMIQVDPCELVVRQSTGPVRSPKNQKGE